MTVQESLGADLAASGLVPTDMQVRIAGAAEFEACKSNIGNTGYVIPYYDINGLPVPHYRIKVLTHAIVTAKPPKYLSPASSKSFIYFPKNFKTVLAQSMKNGHSIVVITEGEKKAASLCKVGIPCAALSGVDSWRSRSIELPAGIELTQDAASKKYTVKMPSSTFDIKEVATGYAEGFNDLIRLIAKNDLEVFIIYDRDGRYGVKEQVQRAAFMLAAEMQILGINHSRISQSYIPSVEDDEDEKIGLDNYLLMHHMEGSCIYDLIARTKRQRATFPRHPNVKTYVDGTLNKTKIGRRERAKACIAVITDMDYEGRRLYNHDEKVHYYFSRQLGILMRADFPSDKDVVVRSFSVYLYKKYGLSTNDPSIIKELKIQFASIDPVESVVPHRVIAYREPAKRVVNELRYQISDRQYVLITDDKTRPLQIMDNGSDSTLFVADQVDPLDASQLLVEFNKQLTHYMQNGSVPFLWSNVYKDVRLSDHNKTHIVASLMSYLNPWLAKWKGMQTPLEFLVGEAGSGKSSLYDVRLEILTGPHHARKVNMPNDFKDWLASVSNAGGLHVMDNVNFADKKLQQQMSDELCRVVTESDPFIESRVYYTNNDVMRTPIRASFAFTCVSYPFTRSDIMQRSFVLQLDKGSANVEYNPTWVQDQISKYGGRTRWVAHHLLVCFLLFLESKNWNPKYNSKSRLINFEQALMTLAKVFRIPDIEKWLPDFLASSINEQVEDSDVTFNALKVFTDIHRNMNLGPTSWSTTNMAIWFKDREEFSRTYVLTNPRSLGRYMVTHRNSIASALGLVQLGKKANVMHYGLKEHFPEKESE